MSPFSSTTIRTANCTDAAALCEFAERSFRETFAALNSVADMDLYCAKAFGAAIQAAEIADPNNHFLVAESAAQIVGYALISKSAAPPCLENRGTIIELTRFYVDRLRQGSGLAQTLMRAVQEHAVDSGATTLWLAVWEHNERAKRFYQRCGFTLVGRKDFLLGTDLQHDLILSQPLPQPNRPVI